MKDIPVYIYMYVVALVLRVGIIRRITATTCTKSEGICSEHVLTSQVAAPSPHTCRTPPLPLLTLPSYSQQGECSVNNQDTPSMLSSLEVNTVTTCLYRMCTYIYIHSTCTKVQSNNSETSLTSKCLNQSGYQVHTYIYRYETTLYESP